MNIQEAAKLATQEGKLMIRESTYNRIDGITGAIKPTNTPDNCWIYVKSINSNEIKKIRCWNPKLDDLIADDWKVMPME